MFQSYGKSEKTPSPHSEVFVQPQLAAVRFSGVLFTSDNESSAPYYIVNFDESGRTDAVTSGDSGDARTVIVY